MGSQDKTKILKPHNVSGRMSAALAADESIDVILFDELTYMVSYGYIELGKLVEALNNRPKMQSADHYRSWCTPHSDRDGGHGI